MPQGPKMTRREFLRWLMAAGVGLSAGGLLAACSGSQSIQTELPGARSLPFELPDWTGDSFAPMHAIRDGLWNRPVPPPHQFVDIAIIGGGLSGLAVATQLEDADFLLLERESSLGGNAKSDHWRGIEYGLGSAYLVDTGEPFGAFYESLGLALKPVPNPADQLLTLGSQGRDALTGQFLQAFEGLRTHLAQLLKSPDFPGLPVESASSAALALDRVSLLDYLKTQHTPPELLKLVDAYCYSALGGGIEATSAYAGINFYSEICGDIVAFPGGNAAVARAMARKIEARGSNRCMTNVSVFGLEPEGTGDRVRVGYFDSHSPGEPRAISARRVVLAVPYYFIPRIWRGLSGSVANRLRGFSYGSYVVANACFEGRFLKTGYDHWTLDNPAFTDFILADGVVSAARQVPDHSVLTIYAPYRNALQGRIQLLQNDREAVAAPIVEQLARYLPASRQAKLSSLRLTRYGHQLLSSRVGIIQQVREIPKQVGPIYLAHSDGQGMAAIESCLTEAFRVAKQIKSTGLR
jgi:protoporphyrinogen oxidase